MPTADSSLLKRIERLENDLRVHPPRFVKVASMPFAILHYPPGEEWALRREVKRLEARLRNGGREVIHISLGKLLWQAIEECEGVEAVVQLERDRGFEEAQRQVRTYLTDPEWLPLSDLVLEAMAERGATDPRRHLVFLLRAGALAPAIYRLSALFGEMAGRTEVPVILFYPGSLEGVSDLRFMDLKELEPTGNYRVQIY